MSDTDSTYDSDWATDWAVRSGDEDAGLRLEKHAAWWWWKGFWAELDDIYRWHDTFETRWLRDPVDNEEYDTDAAFPSLKPRLDVFEIPPRSRKQRGWHQIRSPRRDPEVLDTTLTVAHIPRVTAADIPPELFKDILGSIGCDKTTLGACHCVCRYWAKECQKRRFDQLGLRSREDILALRTFQRTPRWRLPPLKLSHPRASTTISTAPWLHLCSSTSASSWCAARGSTLPSPVTAQQNQPIVSCPLMLI